MRAVNRRWAVTAVETAIVLPSVLLFMYGIFEFGRYLMVLNLSEHAAREGARFAVVQRSSNQTTASLNATRAAIEDRTRSKLMGLDTRLGLTISVLAMKPKTSDPTRFEDAGEWHTAKASEPIAVRIRGTFYPIAAQFMNVKPEFPIATQATMGSEAN